MTTYRLKDDGYSWKVIYTGREKVGRVFQHQQTKEWHAVIPKEGIKTTGSDPIKVFEEAAARAMGYGSAAQLRTRNRRARQAKRTLDRVADAAFNEYYNHKNIEPLNKMFEHPVTAAAVVGAFTRELRRKR